MTDREMQIAAFLDRAGLADWRREVIAADASRRSYLRLRNGDRSRILMDAPPDTGEDVRPFIAIGAHLRGIGLSAPDVIEPDVPQGLLLLEDLGPTLAARHLDAHPGDEAEIYGLTADLLAEMQAHAPPPGLEALTPERATAALAPLFEWGAAVSDAQRARLEETMAEAIRDHTRPPEVLSLRDLHAENLVWRPQLSGHDRLGLLDFQDAMLAPPAYDLASLLDDVRRDVSPETDRHVMAHFSAATETDPSRLAAERAVLSVQRNLRILGIFARLVRRDGKTRYAAFLPRLRRLLDQRLEHPACAGLRPLVLPLIAEAPEWA
ncbi:aminoglycoside phosphotransferase family protein [Histidinibacterium aquaticum]|uniref:Phosphotransferase n=1 Tax=Histidinibacterium aquaticum TaxID=2613962 RepID=A0A5J5GGZ6_9RHOB|nr:phosphotransferase [Histidinibacterium aquaticum]KAA9006804.1 phosphotransferase [Histidinibacterium aquaticum]